MIHSIILERWGCRLRPVVQSDAEFIVRLRTQDHTLGMIHDTSSSIEKQHQWIEDYESRAGDYYWIIENMDNQMPVGTHGLYHIEEKQGEIGRWVMLPETHFPVAAPTLLTYEFAFEALGFDKIVFDVVSDNRKVLKYHRMMGAHETYIERSALQINNKEANLIWFEIKKEYWPEIKAKWFPLFT